MCIWLSSAISAHHWLDTTHQVHSNFPHWMRPSIDLWCDLVIEVSRKVSSWGNGIRPKPSHYQSQRQIKTKRFGEMGNPINVVNTFLFSNRSNWLKRVNFGHFFRAHDWIEPLWIRPCTDNLNSSLISLLIYGDKGTSSIYQSPDFWKFLQFLEGISKVKITMASVYSLSYHFSPQHVFETVQTLGRGLLMTICSLRRFDFIKKFRKC